MKEEVAEDIAAMLAKDPLCYVVVTCSSPAKDGKMEVSMVYEGPQTVARFILEGAQQEIANQQEEDGDEFEE